jgi:hypothetical protein
MRDLRPMRTKLLLLGAAIFLMRGLAAGATIIDYLPTRDSFMRGTPTDLHGSSPNGRASKAFLDFYISDYDRTAITAAIQGELGHAVTFEDMEHVEVSLNFFSNDFQGYQPTALSRPAVFQGTEDWVEGSDTTFGATKGFAVYDPNDPSNNRTWKNIAGADVAFLNLDKVENAAFEEWGGAPYTYREWILDDAVAFAYLTDPLSLGLFLNASDQGNVGNELAQYNNTEIYSRETTAPERQPFLRLTVIPEPATSWLVGVGLLLLARRRRSFAAAALAPERAD